MYLNYETYQNVKNKTYAKFDLYKENVYSLGLITLSLGLNVSIDQIHTPVIENNEGIFYF